MADDAKPPVDHDAATDEPMTVWEHLAELRKRIVHALLGVLPCMAIAWGFKENLLDYLVQPLVKAWMTLGLGKPTLHFANPVDLFVAYMQIAIVVGIIFASPWI